MAILTPFANFHLVARNTIISDLNSGLFTPGTIAGMLGMKGGANNFTPDDSVVIGRKTSKFERRALKGTNQAVIPFMNTLNDDSKWIGYNATDVQFSSTLQMENNATAQISWGELRTGISIDNQILRNAMRQARTAEEVGGYLLNPLKTATREAMSRQLNNLSQALVNGVPASFTTDIAGGGTNPGVLGIMGWISDRNNVCTVDRTAATGAGFRAQYSTASLTPSLSLLDAIIITGVSNGLVSPLPLPAGLSYGNTMGTTTGGADGLHTTGLNAKGSKADIAICSIDVYSVLKEEAIARGHVVTVANQTAETTNIGFTGEYFQYNRTTIAMDYFLPEKTLMVLDSSTFVLHLDEMMQVTPFADLPSVLPGTAQPNRTTATISTRARFMCEQPWKNFLATNVA